MKEIEINYLNALVRTGVPLSYFSQIEPFATWFSLNTKKKQSKKSKKGDFTVQNPIEVVDPVEGIDTNNPEENGKHWTENVFLEKFQTSKIPKGIFRGCYRIYVEFSAYQPIVIALSNPKGTAAIFGKHLKRKEIPEKITKQKKAPEKIIKPKEEAEKLKLAFILDAKHGYWKQVQIFGDLRFRLPLAMVTRVTEDNYLWKPTAEQHIEVPLSHSKITLNRGAAPTLSNPLTMPNVSMRIAQSNLIAKISSLNLSGTLRKPKIIFNNIKLQSITR